MAESKTIVDLDNKSLMHLSSYLSLEDKLKLSLIDDRFDSLIQDAIGSALIDVSDFQVNFTLDEANSIISKFGDYMKKFRYLSSFDDATNNEYAKLFSTYCKNLEEIHIVGFEITVENALGQLLEASKNVRKLKLKKCTLGNAACALFSNLRNLEILNLEESKLTGKYINKLTKLVELNLKNCRNFKCKNIHDICTMNKLKKLNIAGFKQLSNGALRILLATQTSLEVLILGEKYWLKNCERLCDVGNLREVGIVNCYEEALAKYMEALIKARKYTLEALEIHLPLIFSENVSKLTEIVNGICKFDNLRALSFRNCSLFENPDLIKIANSCKQLELLDLHGSSFSDLSIIDSAGILKKLRFLDISHCLVQPSFYSRLVEARNERRCDEKLIVFIKPKTELAKLLESDYHVDNQDRVELTTQQMRPYNDNSILDRLEYLNHQYEIKMSQRSHSRNKSRITAQHKPQASLFYLDDHCLYQIMKHLNVIDKLKLVLTSSHFDHIIKYFLHKDVVNIVKILENFTLREAREIFSRCGHMIRRMIIEIPAFHYDVEYYSLAAQYCTNVEEIEFIAIHLTECEERCAKLIAASAKTLKKIESKYWNTPDSIAKEISKVSNLKTLMLKNAHVTGRYLGSLTNLQVLDLGKCEDVEAKYFNEICKGNQLTQLNIRSCKGLDSASFRTLVETQTNLKQLTLGGVYGATNMHIVGEMKSLIDISLRQCIPQEIIELLTTLSENRGKEIEFLGVKFSSELTPTLLPSFRDSILGFPNLIYLRLPTCNMVDNAFIKRIVKSCPRLEILDLHSTNNLTDDGIIEAVDKLLQLRHFDVKYSGFNSFTELYKRCCEIKKNRNDTIPLKLYIPNDSEQVDQFVDTKEYKTMEKYVILSPDWIHDIDKNEYIRQRQMLKSLHQRTVTTTDKNGADIVSLGTTILDLPDNCLLQIASKLETIDKLKFSYANKRILRAIKSTSNEFIFDINEISRAFTLRETQQLFSEFGEQIQRFQYVISQNSSPIDYVTLVQPYSGSLRDVYIKDAYSTPQMDEVQKLFASPLQKLEKLKLHNLYPLEPIMRKIIEKKEQGVNPFESITELYFFGSDSLQPSHFVEFCQNCRLKRLDIRSCKWLRDEDFTLLLETQSDHLEWLGISCEYTGVNFTDVARLSNLKHISIDMYSYMPSFDVLLDKLIKYRRYDIESIEIFDRSNRMFDYMIISQVIEDRCRKFVNLKKLELSHPKPYLKPYKYD